MAGIILSILTPAVPSRLDQLGKLCAEIERQVGSLPVEHLVFLDNKRRTVGEKRDALLRTARGKYVAFVDDDDWISDDYVNSLLTEAEKDPDVITFEQHCTVNGVAFIVEFGLGNPNEKPEPGKLIKRNAWHVCAWRRSIAILSRFPAVNYGEDWAFAAPLCAILRLTSMHIPRVIHWYQHDAKTTEAPPPS